MSVLEELLNDENCIELESYRDYLSGSLPKADAAKLLKSELQRLNIEKYLLYSADERDAEQLMHRDEPYDGAWFDSDALTSEGKQELQKRIDHLQEVYDKNPDGNDFLNTLSAVREAYERLTAE